MRLPLSFFVPRSAEFVFDCLTNPVQFVAAHPVIYRMDALGDDRYRVFERLPLGPVTLGFTYEATIKGDAARRRVAMRARVLAVVTIAMEFQLTPAAGGTLVQEQVTFTSWLPVGPAMRGIFRKLHTQLFTNIGRAPTGAV